MGRCHSWGLLSFIALAPGGAALASNHQIIQDKVFPAPAPEAPPAGEIPLVIKNADIVQIQTLSAIGTDPVGSPTISGGPAVSFTGQFPLKFPFHPGLFLLSAGNRGYGFSKLMGSDLFPLCRPVMAFFETPLQP